MTTPREKAIEWIELAQAGAEVGIADPAMRVTVLQNLTQAIAALTEPQLLAEQIGWAWKVGDQVFFSGIADKPRDGFPIYSAPPAQTEFNLGPMAKDGATEPVASRFAPQGATEGARILGYADSGGGIRWREDAGGYTGHLWSGAAPSAPSSRGSLSWDEYQTLVRRQQWQELWWAIQKTSRTEPSGYAHLDNLVDNAMNAWLAMRDVISLLVQQKPVRNLDEVIEGMYVTLAKLKGAR